MKHIAIGDTHGRDKWKHLTNIKDVKIVFLGDYFDSRTIPSIIQLQNFNEIIEFKKQNPDNVELLIGNHDYHYFPGITEDYSGYQGSMRFDFQNVLYKAYNEELLNVCYEYNSYLFSHAGLTKTWCINNEIDLDNVVNSVNDLFKYKPKKLGFAPGRNFSGTGNDVTQGPFWVRPASLLRDYIDGYKFVVGHTSQENITIVNEKIFITDCLDSVNEYLEITENEYKVIQFI